MRLVITLSRLFLFLGGILVFALSCKKFSLTLIEPELIAKKNQQHGRFFNYRLCANFY